MQYLPLILEAVRISAAVVFVVVMYRAMRVYSQSSESLELFQDQGTILSAAKLGVAYANEQARLAKKDGHAPLSSEEKLATALKLADVYLVEMGVHGVDPSTLSKLIEATLHSTRK